jgi:hypothetical protein
MQLLWAVVTLSTKINGLGDMAMLLQYGSSFFVLEFNFVVYKKNVV